MRMTNLFSQTLRETPSESDTSSHSLLLRAGFIRPLASGIFSYLPLARRSLTKIENILRQEMDNIGGQEITMPVIHPADIWKETGRWYQIGSEMGRFKDKTGRDMVLAMTHEEVIADLTRNELRSYRQLPLLLYHIQTKWRDDPRPRAGLIRVREFTMKDSYSLDANWEGLEKQYQAHYQAYFDIFNRCKLPTIAVKSDVGMMGGKLAHEFMYLTPIGEDTILLCESCGYSANQQVARFTKKPLLEEEAIPIQKVRTPNTKTIEALAKLLGIRQDKTAKAVFLIATIPHDQTEEEHFIFIVVRGDMEVNETKLANLIHAKDLRPATEAEIRATGAIPGYASPVGLTDIIVVVDDLILQSPNLVSGANEEGFHLLNTNYGRDYKADFIADITSAEDGSDCPQCQHPMRAVRGVEVGNIFQLGTRYSESMGCYYQDQEGQTRPVVMGSYGIGSGRLLACIAEEHHDKDGLVWPISIAPYQVHLVVLHGKNQQDASQNTGEIVNVAEKIYQDFKRIGIEVLYDDRLESPGVKFIDADLIGLPIRITVSERALKQGGLEFKRRDKKERIIISLSDVSLFIKEQIKLLETEICSQVVKVDYI